MRIVPGRDGERARQVKVEVVADDRGGGVAEVRLYRNGKLMADDGAQSRQEETNGGVRLIKEYAIDLQAGPNVLAATALNTDKVESAPQLLTLEAPGVPEAGRLHFLTVGINAYRHTALNLAYARPDAVSVHAFLAGDTQWPVADAIQKLDDAATRANILDVLHQLRAAPAEDVVVVYMAGHGISIGSEWYYIPHTRSKDRSPPPRWRRRRCRHRN
ncbi:MAG: Wd40 repeat subgroup [Rhodospirillaceae bacterium]|nr:MAG: Wd40 repeat subgroup [Rhodospirillaceae bacterium]